jgi:hypothetical protein
MPAETAQSPEQCREVLHYWHTALKYQEALGARPRARRAPQPPPTEVNLVEPGAGQDYFKLPLAGSERFLLERGSLPALPLDAERMLFLEDWLANQYRRPDDDENSLAQLALFPVVHLPRDELAGLLRFPVDLEWLAEKERFHVPTFEERSAGRFPAAPSALRLSHPGRDPEQTLPYFVDTGLLRRTLKLEGEDIEAFFAELRQQSDLTPLKMVEALCRLLEGSADARTEVGVAELASAEQLLARLQRALVARLALVQSKARAYPVALVVSSNRSRATFHVQRDLEEASSRITEGRFDRKSPWFSYISGSSPVQAAKPCWGRWPDAPLTLNQKQALELSLGARLSAIQGPPGTGKTTLILNAVVHQLIEKFAPVADGQAPSDEILVVASTNNRAVDNVMDPLSAGALGDCPLALRLGSREVMGSVTVRTLQRLLDWLTRSSVPSDAEWSGLKQRFAARYRSVQAALEPLSEAHAAQQELDGFKRQRAVLLEEQARYGATRSAADAVFSGLQKLSPAHPNVLQSAANALGARSGPARQELARALQALGQLSRSCEVGDGALPAVERGYRRFKKKQLAGLVQALGVELELGLPIARGVTAPSEAWEEALESALSRLLDLDEALGFDARRSKHQAELAGLATRIDELERSLAQRGAGTQASLTELEAALDARSSADHLALFAEALELRSGWLLRQRREVSECLRTVISQCQRTRSLRGLFQAQRGAGIWLKRLFPSFGCTLLSLGNAFPVETDLVRRMIIDEAGQCHSAYAVSALLRARSALVIGDVHQLEPVIGLGVDDERRMRKGMKLKLGERELEPYRVYDESGNSAQSLADRAVSNRPTLRDHFRCQPAIVALCEAWCGYGMVARTRPSSLGHLLAPLDSPVLFLPVNGEQSRFAGSWQNEEEVLQLLAWTRRLLAAGIPAADVAVITPYRGQFEAIFRALRAHGVPTERPASEEAEQEVLGLFDNQGGVAVGTVHRFQGGERRVVLLSTTVTRTASLGFLNDRVHLLNVAASRAKDHLIVVGHEPTLRAGKLTRILVEKQRKLSPLQL